MKYSEAKRLATKKKVALNQARSPHERKTITFVVGAGHDASPTVYEYDRQIGRHYPVARFAYTDD